MSKKFFSIILSFAMMVLMMPVATFVSSADTDSERGEPLCFTAETSGGAILLCKEGEPNEVSLQYSIDKDIWQDYTIDEQLLVFDDFNTNKVYMRNKFDQDTPFSKGEEDYYKFICVGTPFTASGDITTLLNKNGTNTLTESCFCNLFQSNASLISPPALPATNLAKACYSGMFQSCVPLQSAPELPATTLKDECYRDMFNSCEKLTSAPELPATTLEFGCYSGMFDQCAKLTSAPELPATDLADKCYEDMFASCSSLTSAPELPATSLADNCYSGMFARCSSLTSAPALPATTLVAGCYNLMFNACSSLTSAPALPATTLAKGCYESMFVECTSLTSAPTEALDQDKVSMGTISARKWNEQVELVFLQFATHILAVAQAVDLAGKDEFSSFTQKVHAEVRKISAFVEDDRALDKEALAVAKWLKTTELFQ